MEFDAKQIYFPDETGNEMPAYVFGEREYNRLVSALGLLEAVNRNEAVIEFDVNGNILTANNNFLCAMGYELDEIVGKHHRIFCTPEFAQSHEYQEFWQRLGRGEHIPGDFHRLHKSGRDIWIRASYNPAILPDGEVAKVVEVARDITAQRTVANLAEQALRHLGEMRFAQISDQAMDQIEAASNEIGTVTGEINLISGRSKLLGINAEIEASHAGKYGFGFSVVAREMRALAEQSSQSADRIRLLIDQAADATQTGRIRISETSHEVAELVAEAIGLYDLLTKLEAGEADASCDEKIREIAKSLTRRLAA